MWGGGGDNGPCEWHHGRQEERDPEVQDVENWPKLRTRRWGLGELFAAL